MSRTRGRLLLLIALLLEGLLLTGCASALDDPSWAEQDVSTAQNVSPTASPTATATAGQSLPTATLSATPTPLPTAGPPPAVIAAYPVDGDRSIDVERPLIVVFSRPMDRERVEEALTLEPTVATQLEWVSEERLLIHPAPQWQSDVAYRAALDETAAAIDGATLLMPFSLSFSTGGKGAPIPVLMYHHFAELGVEATQGQREWTVSPQAFKQQLDYLQSHGWQTISTGEMADYLALGEPLPLRPVMITIDDGYREVLDIAYPLLIETELRPVLFVVTDYANYAAYLNWDELAQLVDAGFMIGSHSSDHSDMKQLSETELEQQVAGSKALLEEQLAVAVDAFCYPFGSLNSRVMQAVADAGYRSAYSLNPTVYQAPDDRLFIGRLRVDYDMTLDDFIDLLPD